MDIDDVQLVGGPCGQHGPYTFYKAFKYAKNGVKRLVTLSEFFFVKMWRDSDLLCIGELQLLWIDKNSEQMLASLRLYFLPENTPEGRLNHGEDEVLAISEKVVIRVEDLITWITVEAEWTWGRLAKCEAELKPIENETEECASPRKPTGNSFTLSENVLDFSDVESEKRQIESSPEENCHPHVVILSFPKYCRYRAMMKRLEGVENLYLKYKIVNALGGFYVVHPNTRVLFCRDTFDYPELEGHELLCNHLAPKLKGRPRGKRKKRSVSPGSESNESESSITNHYTRSSDRSNGLRCDSPVATRRSTRCHENNENKQFLRVLNDFMKSKHLPMGRIPSLGYKELNLHEFFTKVQKLGGYDAVTTNRLWKSIFDDMSGHQNSTSAATVIRRHYERFLLAYERHTKGEEHKPLPATERRRLKSKRGGSFSSNTSDGESNSGDSTPSTSRQTTPPNSVDSKETSQAKTSALRSVRVKPERQKDKQNTNVSQNNNNNNNNNNDSNSDNREGQNETTFKPNLMIKTEHSDEIKSSETAMEILKIDTEPVKIEPKLEKDAEPLTTAVAPKVSPEKPLSPVEGKENVPLIKTGDAGSRNNTEPDVHKPKHPQTPLDVQPDAYKTTKLDILKEGGLEVTPVKPNVTNARDVRPSVIMPPPAINIVAPKRIHVKTPSIGTPAKQARTDGGFPSTPPKVVQSKSIYTYSEKTVYGNPKDILQPTLKSPVQAPKFLNPAVRSSGGGSGGDPVDLSITSPQKPVVEIMRIPQSSTPYNRESVTKNLYRNSVAASNTASSTILDGRRLGSNLEITLVGPKTPGKNAYAHKMAAQKRPSMETRKDENGRYAKHKNDAKTTNAAQKSFPIPPTLPPYLSQYHDGGGGGGGGGGPFVPPMDLLYYQAAMQNLYSNGMPSLPPPILPIPTPEQLKFYAELMAHGRLNLPFQLPPEGGHHSVVNNNDKKQ